MTGRRVTGQVAGACQYFNIYLGELIWQIIGSGNETRTFYISVIDSLVPNRGSRENIGEAKHRLNIGSICYIRWMGYLIMGGIG